MPPPLLLNPATLDLSQVLADRDAIAAVNPHRFEFALLDAVVLMDYENKLFAGYLDVKLDAFWVRGHIPGRPLLPGVLMIEAAAQLASFGHKMLFKQDLFVGFAGVDGARFRGVVAPPARLVLVGRGLKMSPRRMVCAMQAFVNDALVFECEITGLQV
ncbi:MAG: beta-hydroxyacyl-ACP dehydratase [Phycisphaerales bacterium]|nr:beta-hydroxyacyl-ACP dehydratase [Phycisphaerales bacterium]